MVAIKQLGTNGGGFLALTLVTHSKIQRIGVMLLKVSALS
jgi:K+-transporting ATPase A subunit